MRPSVAITLKRISGCAFDQKIENPRQQKICSAGLGELIPILKAGSPHSPAQYATTCATSGRHGAETHPQLIYRCFDPRSNPGAGSNLLVCARRQVKVLCCQPAGIVGYQGEADAVIPDIDVRMVARLLRQFAHLVHEGERPAKVLETEGADQFAGLNLPVRHRFQMRCNLLFGEWEHCFSLNLIAES